MDGDGATFGLEVAQLREARGWSRRQLARRARVSPTYLGMLERGEIAEPRPNTREALIAALHPPAPLATDRMARLEADVDELRRQLEAVKQEGRTAASVQEPPAPYRTGLPPIIVFELGPGTAGPAGGYLEPVRLPELTESIRQRYAAFRVSGSCMEPKYQRGQWVVVDKQAGPQREAPVVALVDGETEPLIKRYFPRNGEVELRPLVGPPVVLPRARIEAIWPVIGTYDPER